MQNTQGMWDGDPVEDLQRDGDYSTRLLQTIYQAAIRLQIAEAPVELLQELASLAVETSQCLGTADTDLGVVTRQRLVGVEERLQRLWKQVPPAAKRPIPRQVYQDRWARSARLREAAAGPSTPATEDAVLLLSEAVGRLEGGNPSAMQDGGAYLRQIVRDKDEVEKRAAALSELHARQIRVFILGDETDNL